MSTTTASYEIAVLGGDQRECAIAAALAARGHTVRAFGLPQPSAGHEPEFTVCESAQEAAKGAEWIVCPVPGLGEGGRIYAPSASDSPVLDRDLLAVSRASTGGLILGSVTEGVRAAVREQRIPVFEMACDAALRWRLSVPTAEAVLGLIIERTDRILPELRTLVIGTGKTAASLLRMLVALGCPASVCGRNAFELARFEQSGVIVAPWNDRIGAITAADIVINTVPSPEAVPPRAYPALRDRVIIDTASPPGGIDHESAAADGLDVLWARGLAGRRATRTAADAQLRFIDSVMVSP